MQYALLPPHSRMAKLKGPNMCVSYTLIVTVCMICVVKSADLCLNCADLNRLDSAKVCPEDVKDCGECMKGMMKVSWDISCTPFDLEILENPKNATCTIGKSVIMNCRINQEADCEWFRQGSIINPNQDQEHYRYIAYENGIPAKNCDLEIISYRMEDSGWWQCRISTDYDTVKSSKAWLIPNGQVMILGHPLHAIAQVKKEVVLNCKFNLPVQCEWLHKGKPVRMKKNVYSYVEKTTSGKREDCSMVISSFKKKDAGEWQCRNVPTGRDLRMSSNKAVLYESKSKSGTCTKLGDKLILLCYMNQPGECSWQRNKSVVQISNRYKYVANRLKDTTDCSIIIQKFQEIDAAPWQCGSSANDDTDGTFENNATPGICKGPASPTKSKRKRPKRSVSQLTNASLPYTVPQVEQQPASGNYNFGDNITLPCKFNRAISECFWLRNDHNVIIAHRYKYMGSKNGQNTDDCTITIQQFKETDLGGWICGSVADDQHNGVLSETSYLDVINYDYDSYEVDEEEPDLKITFIPENEIAEAKKDDERPQSSINIVVLFVYLSVALSVLITIVVILLMGILIVWFKRSQRQHAVTNRNTNKYVAINNIELIMEEEMYNMGSQAKLIQE